MRLRWMVGLLAIVMACHNKDSTAPDNSLPGSYALQSIDGKTVPYTALSVITPTSSQVILLTRETLTLRDVGNAWVDSTTMVSTVNGQTSTKTTAESGTWVISGQTLTLRRSDGAFMWAGPVTPRVLTLTFNSSAVFVFQKQ